MEKSQKTIAKLANLKFGNKLRHFLISASSNDQKVMWTRRLCDMRLRILFRLRSSPFGLNCQPNEEIGNFQKFKFAYCSKNNRGWVEKYFLCMSINIFVHVHLTSSEGLVNLCHLGFIWWYFDFVTKWHKFTWPSPESRWDLSLRGLNNIENRKKRD